MLQFRAVLLIVALCGGIVAASASDTLDWAFPSRTPAPPNHSSQAHMMSLPGSRLRFAEAQIRHDPYDAVDWHPELHPPAPQIVRHGRQPQPMACGFCHLPSGEGRPENAALAGLPAPYIARQLTDLANGSRAAVQPDWPPSSTMRKVAASLSRSEIGEVAAYFSKALFKPRLRVVETKTISSGSFEGYIWHSDTGGARVSLGMRIIETPDAFDRFELRDPSVSYTAFVPQGAIARGEALARTGRGGTLPCRSCHGDRFQGALGPPLAGRFPGYIFRQLLAFHTGARHGPSAPPMTVVAKRLSESDMIDLAAYLASRKP